jgi:hypothetical protein
LARPASRCENISDATLPPRPGFGVALWSVVPGTTLSNGEAERDDGRITILVSHRFSTVRMADLIVVLDGSRVAEVGSHEELVAKGGKYAELYGIQAAAYK